MPFDERTHPEKPSGEFVSATSRSTILSAPRLPLPTRIAFVGNYLPRECGIAAFTTDLCTALASEYGPGRLFAIPVNDPDSSYDYPEQVRLELEQDELASYERAADFLNFNGNSDLALNAINWLASDEDLISIRPKPPEDQHITMTRAQMNTVRMISQFGLPLLVVIVGAAVWWRRR